MLFFLEFLFDYSKLHGARPCAGYPGIRSRELLRYTQATRKGSQHSAASHWLLIQRQPYSRISVEFVPAALQPTPGSFEVFFFLFSVSAVTSHALSII